MCEVITAVAAAEKESLQAPRRLHFFEQAA